MKNYSSRFKILITFIFSFAFLILHSGEADAAKVFFEPASATKKVGERLTVSLYLDTEGQTINAVDLGLIFPPLVAPQSVSKSGSVIKLWVFEPRFTSSGVFLAGGTVGGIKTKRGLLGKVTFQAKAIGDGALGLGPQSLVLLNDGQGTSAKLTTGTYAMHVIPQKPKKSRGSILETLLALAQTDRIKPLKFTIDVSSDPTVFGGKYFVAFFSTDKDSGIDHYEIKENGGVFKYAKTPYLLSDQALKSVIHVRAYDASGNWRESVWPGTWTRVWWWIKAFF